MGIANTKWTFNDDLTSFFNKMNTDGVDEYYYEVNYRCNGVNYNILHFLSEGQVYFVYQTGDDLNAPIAYSIDDGWNDGYQTIVFTSEDFNDDSSSGLLTIMNTVATQGVLTEVDSFERNGVKSIIRIPLKTINGNVLDEGGDLSFHGGNGSTETRININTYSNNTDGSAVAPNANGLANYNMLSVTIIDGYYSEEGNWWANETEIIIPAISGFSGQYFLRRNDYTTITVTVNNSDITIKPSYGSDYIQAGRVRGFKWS